MIFSAYAERAKVTVDDVERLSGFAEHNKMNADFDKAREAGYLAYLKEKEEEARLRNRDTKEQQAMPKELSPGDSLVLYKKDLEERNEWEKNQAVARQQFVKENKALLAHPLTRSISEEEELDLLSKRPRFDYKKRTLYSSKGSVTPGSSSSGRKFRDQSPGGSSAPNLPAPPPAPSFDDFPPPPAPMYGGEGGQDEFPPPPPPAFDEFDSDFPPPPPPPPMDFPPPEN